MMLKNGINFIIDIIKNRSLLWELTKKDFRQKYLGSYLGIMWAFIQPCVTVLVFWFVFQVGFKSGPVCNVPFVLWLVTAMFPWFLFNDGLMSATSAIVDNSYLVKKVVFRISLLPIIKILDVLIIHIFLVTLIFVLYAMYGYKPSIYNFQIIYYMFAVSSLLLGLSWITSTLMVFVKDIGQIITVVLQILFWMTPIFWNIDTVPERFIVILKLNPVYYITSGYRDCFIYNKWFWERPYMTVYFWFVTLFFLMLGIWLFKKLKPHFADVL